MNGGKYSKQSTLGQFKTKLELTWGDNIKVLIALMSIDAIYSQLFGVLNLKYISG